MSRPLPMAQHLNKDRVYILIPAFNEAGRITPVLQSLRQAGWSNILVVDDGSTDSTAAHARRAGATVVQLPANRGQGAALRAGIDYLNQHSQPQVIVTFDADGQHQAGDVAGLVKPVAAGKVDVALGSRFLPGSGRIPALRTLLLKPAALADKLRTGLDITDTHNGLRAFNQRAYTALRLTSRGRSHASQILSEIARHNLSYAEVPVSILYR